MNELLLSSNLEDIKLGVRIELLKWEKVDFDVQEYSSDYNIPRHIKRYSINRFDISGHFIYRTNGNYTRCYLLRSSELQLIEFRSEYIERYKILFEEDEFIEI